VFNDTANSTEDGSSDLDLSGGGHHHAAAEEDEVMLVDHHQPSTGLHELLPSLGGHHGKESPCNNKEKERLLTLIYI
jgi:hypothetical protein